MNLYDFDVTASDGSTTKMSDYRGQVVLVVNTASKCGFTPQYAGLEKLWQKYGEQGLTVVGFPCNQFAAQEPGSDDEIAEFCQVNYGVSFPMMAKVDVLGSEADPLFHWLSAEAPGMLGSKSIKWNFTKFLIGRDGDVIKRYGSKTEPEDIAPAIEAALATQLSPTAPDA